MTLPETPVTDTTEAEQTLLNKLDTLALDLSKNSWEFGWTADELWHVVQENFLQESGGKEKKALGAFINFLSEREAKENEARNTIATRIRVARFVPRVNYGKIVVASKGIEPTFHQVKNVIFQKAGELDATKTNAMIDWCIANQWPAVEDIRIQRGVIDPKVAVDPKERDFKRFVKLAQVVAVENPSGPRNDVAVAVIAAWKAEVTSKAE